MQATAPSLKRDVMINYICKDCATEKGAVWPNGHCATVHTALCKVCEKEKGLASVADWNWPKGFPKELSLAAGRD